MDENFIKMENLRATIAEIDNNIVQPDFYIHDDRIMVDRKKFLSELDALETERLKDLSARLELRRQEIGREMTAVIGLEALRAA